MTEHRLGQEEVLTNKVDVQNNILHTLRKASYVGKKQFYELIISSPPPPWAFSGPNISKKVFGGQISAN